MRFLIVFLLLTLLMCVPGTIHAHVNGKSVFTINGVLTKIYTPQNNFDTQPVLEDSDIAPATYRISEPLEFALDTTKFPTNQDIFAKTDFLWDFGDGTTPQTIRFGTTNTHTYDKPGSYLLTVTADYSTAGFTIPPQILETVYITVTDEGSVQTLSIKYLTAVCFIVTFGVILVLLYKKKKTKKRKQKQKR